MTTLSKGAVADIVKTIDSATADPIHGIPGLVFHVVNRNGEAILSHASGLRTIADPLTPMTADTIFTLASLTKSITGIAVMQLHEQGKVELDSTSQIEHVLPELATVEILTGFSDGGRPTYRKPKNKITMRMLLTHTSGFGYDMFNEDLAKFSKYCEGKPEFAGKRRWFDDPIVHEPGTSFEYGPGTGWAGVFVERVSGLKLDEYFKENIFAPLGVNDSSFYLNTKMRQTLAGVHARGPTKEIISIPHISEAMQKGPGEEFPNNGDGGLLSSVPNYAVILSAFLNDGTSPKTRKRILKAETVEYMFHNHLCHRPPDIMKYLGAPMPELSNPMTSWSIYPGSPGWGLSFMLTPDAMPNGRGKNTAEWYGLPNLAFWCDRENGIAAVLGSQILPFIDSNFFTLYRALEMKIYAGLEK